MHALFSTLDSSLQKGQIWGGKRLRENSTNKNSVFLNNKKQIQKSKTHAKNLLKN